MTTTNSGIPRNGPAPGPAGAGRRVPDVAGELRRLTARDRWLLDLLHEHHVLSTEHIAALAFDTTHTARLRLNLLAHRGVLARFRDCVRPGSQSWRWTLGWLGAAYIAARDGQPAPRPGTVEDKANRLASSPRLAHLLGVNGFFVRLAAHARRNPGARLETWWSERTCRQVTGELARPDGHGEWTEDGRTVGFWLEYDTGSEPAHRVLAKLDGYASLRRATGLRHRVLIKMRTARQETSLHHRLPGHPAVSDAGLIVATASGEATTHPAAAVWRVAGHTTRLPLALLPGEPP